MRLTPYIRLYPIKLSHSGVSEWVWISRIQLIPFHATTYTIPTPRNHSSLPQLHPLRCLLSNYLHRTAHRTPHNYISFHNHHTTLYPPLTQAYTKLPTNTTQLAFLPHPHPLHYPLSSNKPSLHQTTSPHFTITSIIPHSTFMYPPLHYPSID